MLIFTPAAIEIELLDLIATANRSLVAIGGKSDRQSNPNTR
jgi:hypothetical protein